MWRRVRIYLFGFGLGLIAVFFLLKNGCKDYNYLPEARILSEIQRYKLDINAYMDCMLKCHDLKVWDVEKLVKTGSVVMKESNPRPPEGTLRDYVLAGTTDSGEKIKMRFQLAPKDSLTKAVALLTPQSATSCNCK